MITMKLNDFDNYTLNTFSPKKGDVVSFTTKRGDTPPLLKQGDVLQVKLRRFTISVLIDFSAGFTDESAQYFRQCGAMTFWSSINTMKLDDTHRHSVFTGVISDIHPLP